MTDDYVCYRKKSTLTNYSSFAEMLFNKILRGRKKEGRKKGKKENFQGNFSILSQIKLN